MQKNSPLVSIIINCYNGEKYLSEALNSVIKQTYTNWEVVFWDNTSTDSSSDIFKKYSCKDNRFNYFYSHKHTILYDARNLALKKCNGDIICFLDVDDFWIPSKLEKQIKLFDDKDVGIVYGNFTVLTQSNKKTKVSFTKKLPSGYIIDELLNKYCVGLLTIALRAELVSNKKNFFNSEYHIIGDFDFVIEVAKKWKIIALQESIAFYRKHTNSESFKNRLLLGTELVKWIENAKKDPILANKNLDVVINSSAYSITVSHILSGNKKEAIKLMFTLKKGLYLWKLIVSLFLTKKINNYFNRI